MFHRSMGKVVPSVTSTALVLGSAVAAIGGLRAPTLSFSVLSGPSTVLSWTQSTATNFARYELYRSPGPSELVPGLSAAGMLLALLVAGALLLWAARRVPTAAGLAIALLLALGSVATLVATSTAPAGARAFELIATISSIDQTSYEDPAALPEREFCYFLREVSTDGTSSDSNTLCDTIPPYPRVDAVSPQVGDPTQMTPLRIVGVGFTELPSSVLLQPGGIPLEELSLASQEEVRGVVPSGLTEGVYDVEVTFSTGTQRLTGAFQLTSTPMPRVRRIYPGRAWTNQDTAVSLRGVNFSALPTSARLSPGDVQITGLALVSATEITGTLPAGLTPGTYDLIVEWSGYKDWLPKVVEVTAEDPATLPSGEPKFVFGLHADPETLTNLATRWTRLVSFMSDLNQRNQTLARPHHVTIMFTPNWGTYILMSDQRKQLVASWVAAGHEMAFHSHTHNHAQLDGYTNAEATFGADDWTRCAGDPAAGECTLDAGLARVQQGLNAALGAPYDLLFGTIGPTGNLGPDGPNNCPPGHDPNVADETGCIDGEFTGNVEAEINYIATDYPGVTSSMTSNPANLLGTSWCITYGSAQTDVYNIPIAPYETESGSKKVSLETTAAALEWADRRSFVGIIIHPVSYVDGPSSTYSGNARQHILDLLDQADAMGVASMTMSEAREADDDGGGLACKTLR